MSFFLRKANQEISASPLSSAAGGEGQCYTIQGRQNESIKIDHQLVPEDLESRLIHQIDQAPATIQGQITWPKDILDDGCGRVVAYLQDHFPDAYVTFTEIYSPPTS